MTNEMIAKLETAGFKRWTKGGHDRLYASAKVLGLVCWYYKTGNISNAEFCGDEISNSEARRMADAKTFIDLRNDTVFSDNARLAHRAAEMTGLSYDAESWDKKIELKGVA